VLSNTWGQSDLVNCKYKPTRFLPIVINRLMKYISCNIRFTMLYGVVMLCGVVILFIVGFSLL